MIERVNYRKVFVFLFCILMTAALFGQSKSTTGKDSLEYCTINQLLYKLESNGKVKFYYNPDWFTGKRFPVALADLPIQECLVRIKRLTGYSFLRMGETSYVLVPTESEVYKTDKTNSSFYIVGNIHEFGKYAKANFSGKILDGKTGEPLVGAILNIEKLHIAVNTNKEGAFTLVLPVGEYEVSLKYFGYEDDIKKIKLVSNGSVSFDLFEKSIHLQEIVISADKDEGNVLRTQMSVIQMNAKTIKELPTSLGEKDVLKSLTLLPGVQSVGDFGAGFNVRGGTTDQNLILIQDIPIFNSSHVFGLTSAINPDNILNVNLLKGGIPAQYGERISSIMNIELGSDTTKEFRVKGGIGLYDARITMETPLFKKKLFLQLSCRTSYSDWLLTNMPQQDLMNSSCQFYDLNGLLTYNVNDNNKLTLFGYYSLDGFLYNGDVNYLYSNSLASIKWYHSFTKNINNSLVIGWSGYNYQKDSRDSLQLAYASNITYSINYYKIKDNLHWSLGEINSINVGFDGSLYHLNPGYQTPYGNYSIVDIVQVQKEKAAELSTYIQDEISFNKHLTGELGLRFTDYLVLGPDSLYVYNPDLQRSNSSVTNVLIYKNNAVIERIPKLEPRVSIRYSFNDENSIKCSYNRMDQFINLISNSAAVSPEDVWKLCDPNTKPLQCDQYAIGYFRNLKNDSYEASLEFYYKKLNHIIDYEQGAQILMNPRLEEYLLDDVGYNCGAELYVKKNSGRLTGWVSYTFSVARQRTTSTILQEQINNNAFYPSTNDRPNDLVINMNYHATRRWRFSALFTYSSGRPETYPEYTYNIGGYQLVQWSARNKYRLPDYNRLDISVTYDENLRIKKILKGFWTLSVINVYGRQNIYSTFYQMTQPNGFGTPPLFSMYKIYIVSSPLPILTYNFVF